MLINIELNQHDLKRLVVKHLREQLGDIQLKEEDVLIETKSKQNFRSEWEQAEFRAKVVKNA